MRTWDAPDFYQPMAAPLHPCAEVLGVDLATVREAATNVEPFNPVSGYTIIAAESLDGAIEMAKGCPILEGGGSIEVCETFSMM